MSRPTDQELAHYVLRHFGSTNHIRPGSFYESLIHTIAAADPLNRGLLAQGFPTLVRMVAAAQDDPNGMKLLADTAMNNAPWPSMFG